MKSFLTLKKLYIDKGLKIFPIIENKKTPMINAWQLECSSDISQICYWFEHAKNCNWGLPCTPNDLFVIDVDMHDGVNGFDSLKKLFKDIGIDKIDKTLMQKTPSGGFHLIFKTDDDLKKVSNSSNSFKGYPGIDIRTDGYICVYPSVIDNKEYIYFDENQEINNMPSKLKEFILSQKDLLKTDDKKSYDKPKSVEKGNRDTELYMYINHVYYQTRLDEEEIFVLAKHFNDTVLNPSMSERTVKYKVKKVFEKDRDKCMYINLGADFSDMGDCE